MSPDILSKILKVPLIGILVLCGKEEAPKVLDYFISLTSKEWINTMSISPFIEFSLMNGTTVKIIHDTSHCADLSTDMLFYTDNISPETSNDLVILRKHCSVKTLRLRYEQEV